uniref:Ribosomal RNA adenine dimethylase domain containing 1 n=1 Tax=Nothoprocta perdicaria TaxID=30464 RepID=A0A8C6YQ36_NOTPE
AGMAAAAGGELWRERQRAADIARVLALYRPLLDAYVVEFFAEDLWAQLPPSWQAALAAAPAPQLAARLLEPPGTSAGTGAGTGAAAVWPLSLLAFRATAQALAFPRHRHRPRRQRSGPAEFRHNRSQSAALHPLLRKHVKPKKQHEIRRLGKVVKRLSEAAGCDRVVDVGSGQGHLSRVLAFGLGLPVSAVEADGRLVQAAERFDRELLRALRKAIRFPQHLVSPGINHRDGGSGPHGHPHPGTPAPGIFSREGGRCRGGKALAPLPAIPAASKRAFRRICLRPPRPLRGLPIQTKVQVGAGIAGGAPPHSWPPFGGIRARRGGPRREPPEGEKTPRKF